MHIKTGLCVNLDVYYNALQYMSSLLCYKSVIGIIYKCAYNNA